MEIISLKEDFQDFVNTFDKRWKFLPELCLFHPYVPVSLHPLSSEIFGPEMNSKENIQTQN